MFKDRVMKIGSCFGLEIGRSRGESVYVCEGGRERGGEDGGGGKGGGGG